ncbi:hypothetical protein [Marinomonas sp. 2405UD68-3]|uniref:hypothetical protein n=1 Tax=Marinomonas sp. 2405UD68-3 TaxID=3391835 RepID=UPI0039C8E0E0
MVGVVHAFAIGRHYIIPTLILTVAVLLGNLTAYAFSGRIWAKLMIFWLYFLLMCHGFFALFWSQKYREILGQAFEPTCIVVVLLLAFFLVKYKKGNDLLLFPKFV